MKNPNPDETMEAQEVDISDVDLSAEPARSASRMTAPPPLPPMAAMMPPTPVAPSHAPPAPPSPSRGPLFYVGILAAVLVVSIAGGTAVALSRRSAAPPVAQAPTASPPVKGAQAPKVITIGVVDMKDDPDGGP